MDVRSGSSPLARGLLHSHANTSSAVGIIPARAGFTAHPRPPRRPARDHPRSRGVYVAFYSTTLLGRGSSPLARGLPLVWRLTSGTIGIIPARAGFTPGPAHPPGTASDHPRSRGVYRLREGATVGEQGSSPLARGLRPPLGDGRGTLRIIPARAGFTMYAARSPRVRQDHPRSRGVYPCRCSPAGTSGGSSPLARGLLIEFRAIGRRRWIIPARAGFTRCRPLHARRPADHPRSRGVYPTRRTRTTPSPGSSPLARGLRMSHSLGEIISGIIPARAGFTTSASRTLAPYPDHPRSRGVYGTRAASASMRAGIIPARAGFTLLGSWLPAALGDHPRSRGVYTVYHADTSTLSGSSPLARGLHALLAHAAEQGGIIPARAGFTRRRPGRMGRLQDHPRSRGVYITSVAAAPDRFGSSPLARGLRCSPGERH